MIRKSIYLFLLSVAVYFGFAYLVAKGSLGSYEGPGEVTEIPLPESELIKRTERQIKDKNI